MIFFFLFNAKQLDVTTEKKSKTKTRLQSTNVLHILNDMKMIVKVLFDFVGFNNMTDRQEMCY